MKIFRQRLIMILLALALALVSSSEARAGDGSEPPPGVDVTGGTVTGTGECPAPCNETGTVSSSSGGGRDGGRGEDSWGIGGSPWCYPSGSPEFANIEAEGGWSLSGDGTTSGEGFSGFTPECQWNCGGESISFAYDEGSGSWSVSGMEGSGSGDGFDYGDGYTGETASEDWAEDYMAGEVGLPMCGFWAAGDSSSVTDICWDSLVFTGTSFICGGSYSVVARATILQHGEAHNPNKPST